MTPEERITKLHALIADYTCSAADARAANDAEDAGFFENVRSVLTAALSKAEAAKRELAAKYSDQNEIASD